MKAGSEGVCCDNAQGCLRIESHIAEGLDVLFVQAWVRCDNKTQQIVLNHEFNKNFSISPREC